MNITIIGERCNCCKKYSQFYRINYKGELEAIDCGFCGIKQRQTKPGNKCKKFEVRGNVGLGEVDLLKYNIEKEANNFPYIRRIK